MKVELIFGHKAVISSLFKLNMESKTSFKKVAQFGMLLENITEKVKLSFGHKPVISSLSKLNIKAKLFTIVDHLDMLFENIR